MCVLPIVLLVPYSLPAATCSARFCCPPVSTTTVLGAALLLSGAAVTTSLV